MTALLLQALLRTVLLVQDRPADSVQPTKPVVMRHVTVVDVGTGLPGFTLHEELALLVESGLSPLQALQSTTLTPARFLGQEADLGSVEVGMLADLVVLDGNPLDDIRNTRRISAVVTRGRLLRRDALDGLLREGEALARGN